MNVKITSLPLPPKIDGIEPEIRLLLNIEPDFALWQAAHDDTWYEAIKNISFKVPEGFEKKASDYRGADRLAEYLVQSLVLDKEKVESKTKSDFLELASVMERLSRGGFIAKEMVALSLIFGRGYVRGSALNLTNALSIFLDLRGTEDFWRGGGTPVAELFMHNQTEALLNLWQKRSAQYGIDRGVEVVGSGFLHMAIKHNYLGLAEKLLQAGVSANQKDSGGLYPWSKAVTSAALELLDKYKADFRLIDDEGLGVRQVYNQMNQDHRRNAAPIIARLNKLEGAGVEGDAIWTAADTITDLTKTLNQQKLSNEQYNDAIALTFSMERFCWNLEGANLKKPDLRKHRGHWVSAHLSKYIGLVADVAPNIKPVDYNFETKTGYPLPFVGCSSLMMDLTKNSLPGHGSSLYGGNVDLSYNSGLFFKLMSAGIKKEDNLWGKFPEWLMNNYENEQSNFRKFVDAELIAKGWRSDRVSNVEYRIENLSEWVVVNSRGTPPIAGLAEKNKEVGAAVKIFKESDEYFSQHRYGIEEDLGEPPHAEVNILKACDVIEKEVRARYLGELANFGLQMALASERIEGFDWSAWENLMAWKELRPSRDFNFALMAKSADPVSLGAAKATDADKKSGFWWEAVAAQSFSRFENKLSKVQTVEDAYMVSRDMESLSAFLSLQTSKDEESGSARNSVLTRPGLLDVLNNVQEIYEKTIKNLINPGGYSANSTKMQAAGEILKKSWEPFQQVLLHAEFRIKKSMSMQSKTSEDGGIVVKKPTLSSRI